MDNLQKIGIKSLVAGVVAIIAAFIVPLMVFLKWRLLSLAFFAAFFGPHAIAFGVFLIRNGDRSEAILGPLGSPQRRKKINFWAFICSIPGAVLCVVLYFVLTQHGYQVL